MAIIAPADLPVVLKLNAKENDALKKYVLTKLGWPHVDVEISEDAFSTILRSTGDFIAGYFPREQRYAVFYTQPLVPTYPLPADAYWIVDCAWDPQTTVISDIFGAEAYLFSFPSGTQLLTTKGPATIEECSKNPKVRLVTPFGPRKPLLRWNQKKQPIQLLRTERDFVLCTPNHPVSIEDKFRMAIVGFPGLHLLNSDDKQPEIIDKERLHVDGTWSVDTSCGCYYASALGKEFYLVH